MITHIMVGGGQDDPYMHVMITFMCISKYNPSSTSPKMGPLGCMLLKPKKDHSSLFHPCPLHPQLSLYLTHMPKIPFPLVTRARARKHHLLYTQGPEDGGGGWW